MKLIEERFDPIFSDRGSPCKKQLRIAVVIDAFRAFVTACQILKQGPQSYFLTDCCKVAKRLAEESPSPVLIGKPEKGSSLKYRAPNSPTRVGELDLRGMSVIHRTAAGGKGVVQKRNADLVFAVSFVNVGATAKAIQEIDSLETQILPMGHEGMAPSLEDDICASYLWSLIEGRPFTLDPYLEGLKNGPGQCFFGKNQEEYPMEDFAICTAVDVYPFAIAVENCGDFAKLFISGSA